MSTAAVLLEFMTIVGVALIAVLAALRFFLHARSGKSDGHKLSKTGAFHA